MTDPKLLYLDIESTMLIQGTWSIGKIHTTFENIIKEREISVVGWAWNNEKVQSMCFNLSKYDLQKYDDDADKSLLQKISDLVSHAEVIIGHNARYFDVSVMRSRLVKHRLPDFVPTLIDDTYLQTKSIDFNSHKLDYLGRYLGEGRKIEHGLDLWLGVLKKNKAALLKQAEYCRGDVELLRKIYKRLKPYTKSSLNLAIFNGNTRTCPHCGFEGGLIIRNHKYTPTGRYPYYQCKKCGKYSWGGKNEIIKTSSYPR